MTSGSLVLLLFDSEPEPSPCPPRRLPERGDQGILPFPPPALLPLPSLLPTPGPRGASGSESILPRARTPQLGRWRLAAVPFGRRRCRLPRWLSTRWHDRWSWGDISGRRRPPGPDLGPYMPHLGWGGLVARCSPGSHPGGGRGGSGLQGMIPSRGFPGPSGSGRAVRA